MRIGTWNLDGRWDGRHLELLKSLDCDVLLLTEVHECAEIPGYTAHPTSLPMRPGKHWAAVLARGALQALPEPQATTALAEVDGVRYAASVLPWRGCSPCWPGAGADTTERTQHAVDAIASAGPTIWGGDWNHSLDGPESAGSHGGRQTVVEALRRLDLVAPTHSLPHHLGGRSIDHIAIPRSWLVAGAEHHPAVHAEKRLSGHDAYVVDVATPATADDVSAGLTEITPA